MTLKSLVCFIFVVSLCSSYCCSRRIAVQKDLDQKLIAAIEKGPVGDEPVIVRLSDLTTFEWDRFYVFDPYTKLSDVRDTLKIDWDPETSIRDQDWDQLLVFVKDDAHSGSDQPLRSATSTNGRIVHYHDHPLEHGDFQGSDGWTGYTTDEAVFRVSFDKGRGRLVLRPLETSKSSAAR